jgi:hypothetical protein
VRFAKQFPNVRVNVVELGCTDTDLNGHTGTRRLRKAHTSMSGRRKRRPTEERGYAGDAVSEKGLPCPASVEVRLSLQALEGSPIDF